MFNFLRVFLAIDLSPDVVRVLDVTLSRGTPAIGALSPRPFPRGSTRCPSAIWTLWTS